MNLKEAFRYQNKLQSFLDEAQSILDRDANITKVENTYLRRKVMAEAEDETVAAVPETEYYEQITDIARFLLHLLDEKETLSTAIRTAKDALDIDMDSEVSLNAARQSVARTFRRIIQISVGGIDDNVVLDSFQDTTLHVIFSRNGFITLKNKRMMRYHKIIS